MWQVTYMSNQCNSSLFNFHYYVLFNTYKLCYVIQFNLHVLRITRNFQNCVLFNTYKSASILPLFSNASKDLTMVSSSSAPSI